MNFELALAIIVACFVSEFAWAHVNRALYRRRVRRQMRKVVNAE